MRAGDDEGDAEAGKEPSFVGLVTGPMDPLEETDREAEECNKQDRYEVEQSHLEVAVHTIVKRGECRP